MRKCPDGVNSLERTAAMAPKKSPEKFFADQWSRCNICGVLIRATKRQLGEPEVDHVYRGRAACSAHDKEKLPSVCDIVRLESEMDEYNQHLANKKVEPWGPHVQPRNVSFPTSSASSSSASTVLKKPAGNSVIKRPAAVMRKQGSVKRKPAAGVLRKPAAHK